MKNKKVRIVDALQHKELIGYEFEIQYIINSNGEPPMTIKQLAEIVANGFKKVETEMHEGFKQVNARIDRLDSRIDNLVKKNNLKE
ncbi:MAG: hypothetical protein LBV48_00420 [Mycoplasmataceae bacterium]|jgi:hypothetical protein|nr:hypothetical protein [Mycoplasmataceae bacterium]